MNISPLWATIVLCLPALGCHLTPFCSAPPPVPPSQEVGCSGIAARPNSVSKISTASRLPYGFRWDKYQGADIEHDIYGDRQKSFTSYRPTCRTCGRPKVASCALACQGSEPTANCGCEQNTAPPLPSPEPTPIQDVSPIPAEPQPLEPALVEPTPAVPRTVDPTPDKEVTPADPPPEEAATEPNLAVPMLEKQPPEPTLVPPRNELPKQAVPQAKSSDEAIAPSESRPLAPRPNSSRRLAPTQIMPAEPPAGLPVPRNDLRRNTIPANSSGDSDKGAKGNSAGFLYD